MKLFDAGSFACVVAGDGPQPMLYMFFWVLLIAQNPVLCLAGNETTKTISGPQLELENINRLDRYSLKGLDETFMARAD